ncbi:MAG: sugar phosphate isomerase/epimerase, partial [Clostridiales bacterium]|nr:sugar phosphate isomerase/epimerase [Clostridiales bacterium]
IYAAFELGGNADLNPADYFLEKPLGEGAVDWPAYLDALEQIGYDGFLTIEREVGHSPEADIGMAVKFLQKMI